MHPTKGNGKLARRIGVFDILVVPKLICLGAAACLAFCYALKQQNTHLSVLLRRLENLEATLQPDFVDRMVQWIDANGVEVMSPNHAGDFWGQYYVNAWTEIARRVSHKRFACYTKSLNLDLTPLTSLPNWILIKSFEGKFDNSIDMTKDNYARIIHDANEKKPDEWLCPDSGAKKNKKLHGVAKVCGATCNYCWELGYQKKLCFLEKKKGWNGRRLFLKTKKMLEHPRLLERIRVVSRKIIELNSKFPPLSQSVAPPSGGLSP
jgi:hypothetical protein